MLTPSYFHTITHSWPLWTWRYPFAPLSNLNPWTAGCPRLLTPSTTAAASISHQSPQFFKPRKFNWPPIQSTGLWLINQFETLTASQKLLWSANWFWPQAGCDQFMSANAARVMIFGTSQLITTPPAVTCWLPDLKVLSATASCPTPHTLTGSVTFNSGNDKDIADPQDCCVLLWDIGTLRVWPDHPPDRPEFFHRCYKNCLYPNDPEIVPAKIQADQPQTCSLNYSFINWPNLTWDFAFQIHTFLVDGRHGCTPWNFMQVTTPPA